MGRSVNVPRGAAGVLYFSFEGDEEYFENSILWSDMVRNLDSTINSVDGKENRFYFAGDGRWFGDEGRVISMCSIAQIVLSEYCGLCSLAIVPQEEPDPDAAEMIKACWEDFAQQWSEDFFGRLRAKLLAEGWELYGKQGSFSNGEGVYARIAS